MKKILFWLLCACLFSSCSLSVDRKIAPSPDEAEEAVRYAVCFYGGRNEHYANSTLHLYVKPTSEKAIDYQLKSYALERLEKNQWIPVDEKTVGLEAFVGIGWRFIDEVLAPFVGEEEITLRMKVRVSDKLGETEVYSPNFKLHNEIAVPEKMESTEFLSLYPYSLYNVNGSFVQDESVTGENAMILVKVDACKVIGDVHVDRINNAVTCQVIDNDACPQTFYQDYLPEDDVILKARKALYYYDNGPLFDTDTITGKEFKELLAEFDENQNISIPVCLIEGQNESEDILNSYGYRFIDEKNEIYYELSQSTMYAGIYFIIIQEGKVIAHALLYTDKKLQR